MRIIRPSRPTKPRTKTCLCGCLFEYSASDVQGLPPPDGDTIIVCPGCGGWISISTRVDNERQV